MRFLHIFHQQKRLFVGPARSRVEKRVLGAYHLLQDARQPSTAQLERCFFSDVPEMFQGFPDVQCVSMNCVRSPNVAVSLEHTSGLQRLKIRPSLTPVPLPSWLVWWLVT